MDVLNNGKKELNPVPFAESRTVRKPSKTLFCKRAIRVPHARRTDETGDRAYSQPDNKQGHDLRQSVAPSSPPPESVPQRSIYVAASAALLGVAAIALWSAQHWRLPWDRPRSRAPTDQLEPDRAESALLPDPADLAAAVDDQPQREDQDRLAIQRLKAARVALERRFQQLDGSKDRRAGILTPFIPESDRPWQNRFYDQSLNQSIEQENLKTDPTADVSMQWDVPQHEANIEALQKEMDDTPEEVIRAEQRRIREELEKLNESVQSMEDELELNLEAEHAAGLAEERQQYQAEYSDAQTESGIVERPGTAEDSDALDGSTSSTQDTETGLSQDIRGASEGLLPGFSKLPDEKKEGAVLPKQSEVTIHEEPADSQEIEEMESSVVDVKQSSVVIPGPVRRSQAPVPKVAGQLRLVAGGACIPAQSKTAAGKGGEDAFFVSEALWGAVGVADGVGGCSEDGVDASLFSRSILETAAAATEHGWGRRKNQGARGLMHIGQTGTMNIPGTSTVCIAMMMLGPTLQVANLGDSGFRVFRAARCLFASQIQQHSFNCPYQAGSPKLHPRSNTANDAEVYEVDLKPHDVVVLGTDGVFDNLWDEDLQDIIAAFDQAYSGSENEDKAEALALTIAKAASARGMNANAKTPWIVAAAKEMPGLLPMQKRLWPRGGKPDDCTAVVAYMQEDTKQY